jgi:hypothetical protein
VIDCFNHRRWTPRLRWCPQVVPRGGAYIPDNAPAPLERQSRVNTAVRSDHIRTRKGVIRSWLRLRNLSGTFRPCLMAPSSNAGTRGEADADLFLQVRSD